MAGGFVSVRTNFPGLKRIHSTDTELIADSSPSRVNLRPRGRRGFSESDLVNLRQSCTELFGAAITPWIPNDAAIEKALISSAT
jgi:hypothetical protein